MPPPPTAQPTCAESCARKAGHTRVAAAAASSLNLIVQVELVCVRARSSASLSPRCRPPPSGAERSLARKGPQRNGSDAKPREAALELELRRCSCRFSWRTSRLVARRRDDDFAVDNNINYTPPSTCFSLRRRRRRLLQRQTCYDVMQKLCVSFARRSERLV